MELYIGGCAQGKLAYVTQKYGVPAEKIKDGGTEEFEGAGEALLYNRFHLWIRRKLEEGACPERLAEQLWEANPDCIILCDEVGNGIVPLDPFEREYRERTGRILCRAAERAERVERVICGIGQRIK